MRNVIELNQVSVLNLFFRLFSLCYLISLTFITYTKLWVTTVLEGNNKFLLFSNTIDSEISQVSQIQQIGYALLFISVAFLITFLIHNKKTEKESFWERQITIGFISVLLSMAVYLHLGINLFLGKVLSYSIFLFGISIVIVSIVNVAFIKIQTHMY